MAWSSLASAAAVALAAAGAARADTLVRHLRVVDVEAGTVGPAQDMRLADGRIAEIGPAGSLSPEGAEVIGTAGAYAIPSL
jgi:adenine deaminase